MESVLLFNEQSFLEKYLLFLREDSCIVDSYFVITILSDYEKHYHLKVDEDWVNKYLEYDFFSLFRITQSTCNILLNKIGHLDLQPYHGGGILVPADKQLLMTLWWLGKGETLISVSERFGVTIATVFNCTERVLDKILLLLNEYICWPTPEEMITVSDKFEEICGFPGVIGAIDGTNINFKAPQDQQESYIDKNSNHSIKLQAVGTSDKLLTNIFAGFPGSAHDHRVFRNSGFVVDIQENNNKHKYFPLDEYHLVGDKAYPLLEWLMCPYRNEANLNVIQRRYNQRHSRTRIVIENIFGTLKGRWRILKFINVNSVKKAVKIIAACCTLHNFCLINIDLWDQCVTEEMEIDGENPGHNEINNRTEAKRLNIAQSFF